MEENQVTESQPVTDVVEHEDEKMVPQSHVNKIIKQRTYDAIQAKRELEEKHQKEIEAIKAAAQQQSQRNEQVPRDLDANAIYQQVQERFNEEMRQRQLKEEMERVATSYLSKMANGKSAYEDFDEITKDFDPTAFPQLTYLVSGIDNAADVIYELARNPLKLAGLNSLAKETPKLAQSELLKLSRSIAENRQAQADESSYNVASPLDRLQASRISGSNDKMSISDLRNQPWLKG
jgi:hypothetical protein